jgi:glutamate N-acetyltransferase/amino-acid N-acetyltransferase
MTSTDQATRSETCGAARLPDGFRYAGVICGIKPSGNPDLSLVVCDRSAVAAGVYTQNQVVAAPVVLCHSRTPSRSIRAVVTNSGNANACTGQQGMQNAVEMCRQVAARIGCGEHEVLVMSTGVIGQQLPMDRARHGIDAACDSLAGGYDAFASAAEAIRTTDKDRKTAIRAFDVGGKTWSLAAMAKGAGMIAPNMATMLAVVLTDAPLSIEAAQHALRRAAARSFNRVSVDGHTSTNDTFLLLSSGQGESLHGAALETFQQQLDQVSIELAKKMVADGEGASHVMAIRVTGAETDSAAAIIAKSVAESLLVKTAITGGDPNWGRIVSAAGYANARIDPQRTSLRICGKTIYENGAPQAFDRAALSAAMKQHKEVPIELQVGLGPGSTDFWSSDLTAEYVHFNSEYTT